MHDDERRGTHIHTHTHTYWMHKSCELHIASMPNIAYTILLSYCTESQFHNEETWSSGGKIYTVAFSWFIGACLPPDSAPLNS